MADKKVEQWKNIEYSDDLKAKIKSLQKGEVMAVRMKHTNSTKDEKVQVEFAEKLGNRTETAASFFNANDDRFSSGAQRCWETVEIAIAEKMFGKIPDGEASVEIGKILGPEGGLYFRIQHTEDVEENLTESEAEYPESYLKRAGAEGNYFYTPNGSRVISRNRLIRVAKDAEVNHTYLEGNFQADGTSAPALASPISNEVADASI